MIFLMDLQVKQMQLRLRRRAESLMTSPWHHTVQAWPGAALTLQSSRGQSPRGPGPSSGRRQAMFAHGSSSGRTEGYVQVCVRVPGTLTRRSTAVTKVGKEAPVPAAGPPGR